MNRARTFAVLWWACLVTLGNGCSSNGADELPPNAVLVAEGNRRLAYRAPADGMVWVYDNTNQRLLYASQVARDQTIVVNSKGNRVVLDGRIIEVRDFDGGDRIQIHYHSPSDGTPRITADGRVIDR